MAPSLTAFVQGSYADALIVDCDFAGLDAVGRFEAEAIKWKHVSLLKLQTPDHLQAACDLGVALPVTLEELWPAAVWQRAQEQGWLVQRPRKGLLSEGLLARMVDEDLRLSDVVENDWRIYFENQVNDDPASTAKMDWASYTASLNAAALEPICQAHLAILDQALAKLGIT